VLSAIETLHDIALYKFNIHIHIHVGELSDISIGPVVSDETGKVLRRCPKTDSDGTGVQQYRPDTRRKLVPWVGTEEWTCPAFDHRSDRRRLTVFKRSMRADSST